ADCGNDRIQRFSLGQVDGKTEIGSKSLQHPYSLSCPTAITFDAQRYLFIVDSNNYRIILAGPTDVRCVIGCDGISIKSTLLLFPSNLAFDGFGNLFIVDSGNDRIEKFEYSKNSCDKLLVNLWTKSIELTKTSHTYCRACYKFKYYYGAFQIEEPESLYYSVRSSVGIDTYGYIYENNFNPLNPNENLPITDDDGGFDGQFKFELPLYNDGKYILVVTTNQPMITGNIEIKIFGLKNVTLSRLSE
ncbi:unnamed protein product, partial [Adineta ricciae]